MRDWLIGVLQDSNPASVVNLVLNLVQIAVTVAAFCMLVRARNSVRRITTDGTKWLTEQVLRSAYDEHFSRLYQRVDALAAFQGKEFVCNPETLIPHRGAPSTPEPHAPAQG
jgi:hypothetical protein